MPLSRRDFLRSSAMGVSVSFLAPNLMPGLLAAQTSGRILVILQLAGGNDGINTFIPYADSRYRSLRPTLSIPESQILMIDDRFGLHPSLAKIRDLYESGRLTFVNDVGFSSLDRSHFRCQDVWQTADDSYGQVQRGIRGWLGRYADLYLGGIDSPLTTVSIGNRNALGLVAGDVLPTAVTDAGSFEILTDPRYPEDRDPYVATVRSVYAGTPLSGDLEVIRSQGTETLRAIDLLKTIPGPSASAGYPASALGRAFQLTAQLIAGEVGTHAVWVSTGGYDTHSTQANTHATLLLDVSESLAAFHDDLADRRLSDRVLVLAWSEFGRRVQENASQGTDHGKAGTVFLMGDRVRGGTFYGEAPSLSDLDNGDLKTRIDFRSVYWTVIEDWLGNDPLPVLNAQYENLGFIEKAKPRRRSIAR
ncbi:MAG TPA: DUF1501 domain-containing protein [Thermoanaerobaculia bacterium]|nr:DUF1501 domain-containing protein [Thermoanaerobaculia bacterium]